MKPRAYTLVLLLSAGVPINAQAGVTFFSSWLEFDRDFPEAVIEDFEEAEIAPLSSGAVDAPLTWQSSNAFFDPGTILFGMVLQDVPGPGSGADDGLLVIGERFGGVPSKSVGANRPGDSLDIVFPEEGAPAVAMDVLGFARGLVTVTVVGRDGTELGNRSFLASADAPGFLGVSSDPVPIARINVRSLRNDVEIVDNIAFVPEPSDAVACFAAVIALLLLGRATLPKGQNGTPRGRSSCAPHATRHTLCRRGPRSGSVLGGGSEARSPGCLSA